MIKDLTVKPLGKDMTYQLVYLSEYAGQSPWDDHSDEEWNYAASIYE